MLTSQIMQQCYIDLYKELRRYIWDYDTINDIVNLEISTFQAFPDISEVQKYLNLVKLDIKSTVPEDEELYDAVEAFADKLAELSTSDDVYHKLPQVEEVIK